MTTILRVYARRMAAATAVLMVIGVAGRAGAADEARAVTAEPRAAGTPSADPLLGALSFGSSQEPISVSANALDFDYKTRVLTYRGEVVATQGDMKLQSNTLKVWLDMEQGERLKEVVAEGSVRLSKGTRWATGGRAVFNQVNRTVVLSEEAVLHDGLNQVSGERVVVYLDEQRSVVDGGSGRVKAVLYPPEGAADTIAGGGGP